MRHARGTMLLLVGLLAIGALAAPAVAQTTTAPEVPTTIEPTTIAPTTVEPTTEAPATTEPEATTEPATTTPSETTTTAPPATSSSDSSPLGWIIAILAVLAVGLIIALVLLRRNASSARAEWKNAAASALRDADLTRDMLADEARPGAPEDATRVSAVRDSVERVARQFDGLASDAPNDEMRQHSIAMGTSLRGYFFALESEQMLHSAPTTPTADQLANADATKRARAAELDTAIAAVRTYVAT